MLAKLQDHNKTVLVKFIAMFLYIVESAVRYGKMSLKTWRKGSWCVTRVQVAYVLLFFFSKDPYRRVTNGGVHFHRGDFCTKRFRVVLEVPSPSALFPCALHPRLSNAFHVLLCHAAV